MKRIATKLRIGEKIGLVFGVVALIFLGVIWNDQAALERVLADHAELDRVYGARKSYAFEIESRLSAMRAAEEHFLITRDLAAVEVLAQNADALLTNADELKRIDAQSAEAAKRIQVLTQDYRSRFEAIVQAWQIKGLDHDSGLQGAFRDRAHELEKRAANFNVDRPYLLLLQIRRAEKDLGLRREAQYQQRVHDLLDEFAGTVANSGWDEDSTRILSEEIGRYRTAFDHYAETVLADEDIQGGKGPFRDTAHRIEAHLLAHYVPDMEVQVLQLRRREKDYLLRGDPRYVEMVGEIVAGIRAQVEASSVAGVEQTELLGLLSAYERDFLALVEHNGRIQVQTAEMHEAAAKITPLVESNLDQANNALLEASARIEASSTRSARRNLFIAVAALVIGGVFTLLLTWRIVRPVREMAGLLDRLTHENPMERIETDPKGRDEINAMAASLNTMADHKSAFFDWWRTSMKEAIAIRDMHRGGPESERFEAAEELRTAAMSKVRQINAIGGQIKRQANLVLDSARELEQRPGAASAESTQLRNAAASIISLLGVVEEDE